jgi:hypothetical protein
MDCPPKELPRFPDELASLKRSRKAAVFCSEQRKKQLRTPLALSMKPAFNVSNVFVVEVNYIPKLTSC